MPRNPLIILKEAKQIAVDHNCYVTESNGKYLLHRKMATRSVLIGERSTPAGLHTLVCKATNFQAQRPC